MRRWLTRITDLFNRATVASEARSPSRTDAAAGARPAANALGGEGPSGLLLKTELRMPRRLDLAFDRHLVGEGWHYCEMAGNVPFRWMGLAESATIWLAVDRSANLALDLSILIMIEPAFADQIRVAVGEPPDPVAYERTADGLSFVLPRAPDHAMPTKITLRARGRVPESESDPRCLSIACSRLRVRPLDVEIAESARIILRTTLSARLPDRDAAARTAAAGGHCEIQRIE